MPIMCSNKKTLIKRCINWKMTSISGLVNSITDDFLLLEVWSDFFHQDCTITKTLLYWNLMITMVLYIYIYIVMYFQECQRGVFLGKILNLGFLHFVGLWKISLVSIWWLSPMAMYLSRYMNAQLPNVLSSQIQYFFDN